MAEMRRKFDQDFRGRAFHDMFCTHSSPPAPSPPRHRHAATSDTPSAYRRLSAMVTRGGRVAGTHTLVEPCEPGRS